MKLHELNQFKYVSVQPTIGGTDEIQQLFLSYATDCHVALSGPPGVGKTLLVDEFAAITGQKTVSRVMGPKVNESLLISYPDLISQNGASVTVTRPGLLARALKDNCVYFADEIDRLTEDNQKLHNSAFDNRRSVTMRNGQVIKGGKNFFGIIAYNPTEGMKNDLESALADRFVHINFEYFSPEIQSMISLRQSGFQFKNGFNGNIIWKAVLFSNSGSKKIKFYTVESKKSSLKLIDPFSNTIIDLTNRRLEEFKKNLFVYLRLEAPLKQEKYLECNQYSLETLSLKLASFCENLRSLSENGTRGLDKEILAQVKIGDKSMNDKNNMQLHVPSSRIHQAALRQFHYLTRVLGCPIIDAQVLSAFLIINQAGYGKFGTSKTGQISNRQLFESLAASCGLLPMREQRTFGSSIKKTKKR